MEIFVDCGMFELLAGLGLAALARQIYTRRVLALICLALSLLAPAVLIFFTNEGAARWLAVLCLATALLNAALIISLTRRYNLAALLVKQPRESAEPEPVGKHDPQSV
jgi:peptidoglycan/LPS O-acetylase OafA/YrhL